jgi:hypothetical protein
MVSGMPSIINVDKNNICSIDLENCAPYNVTLKRDDILGTMETEEEEMVLLTSYLHIIRLPKYAQPLSKSEQEETFQRRDSETMQFASSRRVQGQISGHSVQTPGHLEH